MENPPSNEPTERNDERNDKLNDDLPGDYPLRMPENFALTEGQIAHAYIVWWRRIYAHQDKDLRLDPFLLAGVPAHVQSHKGWLELAREAGHITKIAVARRLGMSRQGYGDLELREREGRATLGQIATAAEALGCELVYAIRPKSGVRYSAVIWKEVATTALEHPAAGKAPEHMKPYSLATCAVRTFKCAKFRRQFGWARS